MENKTESLLEYIKKLKMSEKEIEDRKKMLKRLEEGEIRNPTLQGERML